MSETEKILEKLKNRINILKQEIKKAEQEKKDPVFIRRLRKLLKRAQRRYKKLLPISDKEKLALLQKRLENLSRIQQELEKKMKPKPGEHPKVRSIRKKVKTLTRQIKKLQKLTASSSS